VGERRNLRRRRASRQRCRPPTAGARAGGGPRPRLRDRLARRDRPRAAAWYACAPRPRDDLTPGSSPRAAG